MTATCARCGTSAEAPDGGLPAGWSIGADGRGGVERLCRECLHANIRSVEANLPGEYW